MPQLFLASTALVFALVASIPAAQVFSSIGVAVTPRVNSTRVAAKPQVAGVAVAALDPSTISSKNTAVCEGNCLPVAPLPILVTTGSAVSLTQTSAALQGQVTPNGHVTSGWFRYATERPISCTDNFGIKTPIVSLGSGSAAVTLQREITGLLGGATYYYCAFAGDGTSVVGGGVQTFSITPTTQKPDLTITLLELAQINNTSARYLRATVKNVGTGPLVQNVSLSMYNHAGVLYPVTLLYSTNSPLAAGASVEVVGPRAQSGSYNYRAVVDLANAVSELSEDNNALQQQLVFSAGDVRVSLVKVENLTSRTATVSWRTSKPTTGAVQLSNEPTINASSSIVADGGGQNLAIDHTVTLQNLAGGQRYNYRLIGWGEDVSYTSAPYAFTTYRPGEDLPDLVPQTLTMTSSVKNYAGYPFNGENVTVRIKNASKFNAGPFGVWLIVREAQTNAIQCAPAITVDGLQDSRSMIVNFTLNDFMRCAPLTEGQYYLELAIDKSPVADINQVVELNEQNNTRTLPPFTVLPASAAPTFTNFLLRPDPSRNDRTRLEFSLLTNLSQTNHRPDVLYFTEPADGTFNLQTSRYTRNGIVSRDSSGRYYVNFNNASGVIYHVRTWAQRTNVFSDDITINTP